MILTGPYIRYSLGQNLSHFTSEILYLSTITSPFPLPLVNITLLSGSLSLTFLDSTYSEIIQYLSYSIWLNVLNIMFSSFIHVVHSFLHLYCWMYHCEKDFISFLYPFTCQQTFRLIPHLGCCEQCSNTHGSADTSSKHGITSFRYISRSGCSLY